MKKVLILISLAAILSSCAHKKECSCSTGGKTECSCCKSADGSKDTECADCKK